MAKQNRVTPKGAIEVSEARGSFMGNRGCLHDRHQNIVKQSARKAWIICALEYKGSHRRIMAPGAYTELFFLDEATALAAGHRPCMKCRYSRGAAFLEFWNQGNRCNDTLSAVDERLSQQRRASTGTEPKLLADIESLPNGVFFTLPSQPGHLYTRVDGETFKWSHHGYSLEQNIENVDKVLVVTPASTVAAILAGYEPYIHKSASSKKVSDSQNFAVTQQLKSEHVDVNTEQVSSEPYNELYKLVKTPGGRELAVYFAGILKVTGMSEGASYPLKKFFSNFSGHTSTGRIEKVGSSYRLSKAGQEYFKERNLKQGISEKEIDLAVQQIKSGGPGWQQV